MKHDIDPADPARTQFACEFDHDGATWNVVIFAEDLADAHARVQSARASLRVVGEILQIIKVEP